ncbi:MAG: hypothetical protein IT463_01945 [Planctomycetes bacterium]|nr:hypothetical protein [Planctomycetota bacterium]
MAAHAVGNDAKPRFLEDCARIFIILALQADICGRQHSNDHDAALEPGIGVRHPVRTPAPELITPHSLNEAAKVTSRNTAVN